MAFLPSAVVWWDLLVFAQIRVKSRSGMKHKKITSSVVSFFEENTCRVEVQDQREKLQRVYFPKPCSAKFLTRFTMDKVTFVSRRLFVWHADHADAVEQKHRPHDPGLQT